MLQNKHFCGKLCSSRLEEVVFTMNLSKKNKETRVSEAQSYLRDTDRVSRPMAILMSLLAFLAVFAVVFSLFLGGRWLYNTLKERSGSEDSETTQATGDGGISDDTPVTVVSNTQDSTGPSVTVVNGDGASSTTAPSTSSSSSSLDSTVPATVIGSEGQSSAATTALPRTGPASNMLIAAGTVVIAGVTHSYVSRKKS